MDDNVDLRLECRQGSIHVHLNNIIIQYSDVGCFAELFSIFVVKPLLPFLLETPIFVS